ncbi:hypothetical protein Tco_0413635 [Tanacetum coccineum]
MQGNRYQLAVFSILCCREGQHSCVHFVKCLVGKKPIGLIQAYWLGDVHVRVTGGALGVVLYPPPFKLIYGPPLCCTMNWTIGPVSCGFFQYEEDNTVDCGDPSLDVLGSPILEAIVYSASVESFVFNLDGFNHATFRAARSIMYENTEKSDINEEEKKYAALQGSAPHILPHNTVGINDDEAGSSRSKCSRHETVEEIRAFNINEPIYAKLCHEFYSTYAFDEVCADDELQTKKIIKFRLGGRGHNLTLLEFARRLGLYQVVELEEDGFNVYFEGGLRNDDNFNDQDYWLSISREDNLGLPRSHTSTIRRPILRVIHKMITYGLFQRTTGYDKVQKNDLWLLSMFDARHQNGYANVAWVIARWMKRKGVGTQRESQIYYGQFISKLARKCRVLTEDVVRSLKASIYYRDLDTTTLRDLIDSDGKLIPKDPQPGVPRVGIPRPPSASMQDLYDRMGRMKIRQEAIKRMEYRQSYHWDRYQGVFKHMARVYSVLMQGAYNPPGYAQSQYDQYYWQYPPPQPQYQQQQ